jgi:hypothetical protein
MHLFSLSCTPSAPSIALSLAEEIISCGSKPARYVPGVRRPSSVSASWEQGQPWAVQYHASLPWNGDLKPRDVMVFSPLHLCLRRSGQVVLCRGAHTTLTMTSDFPGGWILWAAQLCGVLALRCACRRREVLVGGFVEVIYECTFYRASDYGSSRLGPAGASFLLDKLLCPASRQIGCIVVLSLGCFL